MKWLSCYKISLPACLMAISGAWLVLLQSCSDKTDTRPNILFAFADDWGKYAGCYADIEGAAAWQGLVSTPMWIGWPGRVCCLTMHLLLRHHARHVGVRYCQGSISIELAVVPYCKGRYGTAPSPPILCFLKRRDTISDSPIRFGHPVRRGMRDTVVIQTGMSLQADVFAASASRQPN